MKPPISTPARRPSFRRAFIPFWIALLGSALVLAVDYHARHAPFTRLAMQVSIEGKEPEERVSVEVNGQRQNLDAPVPMGFANVVVSAPGCESVVRSRFVWYGVTDLGTVDLVRSLGTLTASILPAPDSYELTGKRGSWTNTTGAFNQVPVGRYELVARYGPALPSERLQVEVKRLETSRVDQTARIGTLELSSEPAEGEFELIAEAGGERRAEPFPRQYSRISAGAYRLIARRPGYQRELRLEVGRNQTNRVVVKFVYGAAKITTTPSGATIFVSGNERGTSPLTMNQVVPGTLQIEARLPGHDVVKKELRVEDDAVAEVSISLVNTEYREAMEGARLNLEKNRYAAAARFLEVALAAQPGDTEAAKLLPGTLAHAWREKAVELAQQGEYDAALKALESGLTGGPEDVETLSLQKKLQVAKADFDLRLGEAQFGKLVAEARFEASRQNYDQALALLGEAKKISPDKGEVAGLETSYQQDKAKWLVESAEKRRLDQLAARAQEFQKAWERALREERDARLFSDYNWTTTKSIPAVRSAVENLGKAFGLFNALSLVDVSPHVFTAKVGEVSRAYNMGYYAQVGVVTYGEGDTRITLRMFVYNSSGPDPDVRVVQTHVNRTRARFARLLDNDLK